MSTLVRPSEAANLAIHACALMAAAGGAALTTSCMAGAIGASEAHLSKVLQRLSRAGLVAGTRGPGGGFKLAAAPASLSLRRVYEAVEGPLDGSGCLMGVPMCRGAACPLASLLGQVESRIAEGLSDVTLAELGPAVTRGLAKGTARKHGRSHARGTGTRSRTKGR
jgi:Rrf2 family transcriptional regulator, nitric oxide-sensitive transcriptional repressor